MTFLQTLSSGSTHEGHNRIEVLLGYSSRMKIFRLTDSIFPAVDSALMVTLDRRQGPLDQASPV